MPVATDPLTIRDTQEALFERGFKTWCENTAVSIRLKMGLTPIAPLSPNALAEQLHVAVWELESVPDLKQDTLDYLGSTAGDEWSAVTVEVGGKRVIVVNPTHSTARQASDLMHELAHVILGHEAAKFFLTPESYAMREFNEKQEAEANWFAGCLLLPRTALANSAYMRKSVDTAIEEYGVSRRLYTYRSNKTGVSKQFRRSR